jgi:hypothetical protein
VNNCHDDCQQLGVDAMKSLWGMIKARRRPFKHRYVIKVYHPDAFSRDVPADDLPGNLNFASHCSSDTKNESLAVLEVIVVGSLSTHEAAVTLRRLADAMEQTPNGFMEWVGKHYSVKKRAFVGFDPAVAFRRKR